MKPSIPIAQLNNTSPDAIRWFIIGAYQAGASESEIVSLTNLSRYTIRYAIASFVKTGLPSLKRRKQLVKKKVPTKKPTFRYQNHPAISEDDQSGSSSDEQDDPKDIKIEDQDDNQLKWKHSLLLRRKGSSTATDTIEYVLYKGRKYEAKNKDPYQRMVSRPPSPPEERPKSEINLGESSTPVPQYRNHPTEAWSQVDDKILLRHIFTRTGHWDKLDQVFDGKHSINDCIERWDVLQHYLIKELKKTGTSSW